MSTSLNAALKRLRKKYSLPKEAKEAPLRWVPAPKPFNEKKLKRAIHSYLARQKRMKASIIKGELPLG